jgi:hypothetical protein
MTIPPQLGVGPVDVPGFVPRVDLWTSEGEPLVGFLEARLAEDEKVAHEAADTADAEVWESDSDGETVRGFGGSLQDVLRSGWQTGDCGHDCPEVTHAARFDPHRVLADSLAKRALIADLTAETHDNPDEDCKIGTSDLCPCTCGRDDRVIRQLRILTQPWVSHPDYPKVTQ